MKLKTVQWNIGGGKIRTSDADPTLDESYNQEGMDYVVKVLKGFNPDIITLQETHSNDDLVQAEHVAKQLGLDFSYNDNYDQSHIDPAFMLGQAILSRYPITNHQFKFFYNPRYSQKQPDGSVWVSHNKGVTTCELDLEVIKLKIQTLHLIPFERFGVDVLSDESKLVRGDLKSKIGQISEYHLLQGDFNFKDQSLQAFLPELMENGAKEVLSEPTTPKGKNLDHVIYNGLGLVKAKVLFGALTDHYPVMLEFEL